MVNVDTPSHSTITPIPTSQRVGPLLAEQLGTLLPGLFKATLLALEPTELLGTHLLLQWQNDGFISKMFSWSEQWKMEKAELAIQGGTSMKNE